VKILLEVNEEFTKTHMDQTPQHEYEMGILKEENQNTKEFINHIGSRKVLQLKNNFIPKGLVPLEQFFDNNDVLKKPRVHPKEEET